jgi:hypothetical protein
MAEAQDRMPQMPASYKAPCECIRVQQCSGSHTVAACEMPAPCAAIIYSSGA